MNKAVFQANVFRSGFIRAVAIYSGSTYLAELAGRVGFDAFWVEMEHGHADYAQLADLCLAAQATNVGIIVRVPDSSRAHILRALDVGAHVIVVPGVDTPESARVIVEHGKFPPLGKRGFHSRSRGSGFGLQSTIEAFAWANANTHLIAQIESEAGVKNLDPILAVEGMSGILVGPGDLSMSMGIIGQFDHPILKETVVRCIRRAREAGKRAGIFVGHGPLRHAAMEAGCDLLVCGSDVGDLAAVWAQILQQLDQQLSELQCTTSTGMQ